MANVINSLTYFIGYYSYFAVFVFLFSLSFALPISEEAALIIVGYLTNKGIIVFPYSLIIAFLGILCGDLFLFFLSKFAGSYILRSKFFSRLVKKEKVEIGKEFIEKNGPKIIFFSRFIVGIRASMMIASGFLNMDIKKFSLFDFLAAVIFIPFYVFVGYFIGENLNSGVSTVEKIGTIVLVFVVIITGVIIAKKYWKKKIKE